MTTSTDILLKTASVIVQDSEVELIDRLTIAAVDAGVWVERIDIANIYVALKHRPMAILTGPAGSGKCTFIKLLARILAGNDGPQSQIMPGHAWYAGGSPANTTLISMHSRLITEKLFSVIEEALQPENAQQIFIVGLTQISPAELLTFFTELAGQVQRKEIMHIEDIHLSAPLHFPRNLLLIGTMDTGGFDYWDEDLLRAATIIKWRAEMVGSQLESTSESKNLGREYLRSRVRNSWKAYEKLMTVTASTKQPLQAVVLVRRILQAYGMEFSPGVLDEVILYMANAWSAQGNGLFDPSTSRNLAIAADLALAQLVLPRYLEPIQSSGMLQAELYTVLDEHLPRCNAFLRLDSSKHDSLTPKGL
jgi:hypothetical protein